MFQGKIFPDIASVAEPFSGILLDAYGVFWGGNAVGVLPGAQKAMENLMNAGKIVGILSNSTRSAKEETEKLEKHGLLSGRHFHFFVTSGEIARSVFSKKELPFLAEKKKFYSSGSPHPKFSSHCFLFEDSEFVETPDLGEVDFVYLGIPHIEGEDQTDPEIFRDVMQVIRERNIPVVCANPDRFAQEGNPPRCVVRQGSLADMYEKMGGQTLYIGKPSERAYAFAFDHFAKHGIIDPKTVLMVGDTPETDIRGAKNFGMPSALIIGTGITATRYAPHQRGECISELPVSDRPDYYVERLGSDISAPP